MSGIIWGNSLVCAYDPHDTEDFEHSMYAICDLNNWRRHNGNMAGIKIDYDAATRTNVFDYVPIASGGNESFEFQFNTKPNTDYYLRARINANYTPGYKHGTYMFAATEQIPDSPPVWPNELFSEIGLGWTEISYGVDKVYSVYFNRGDHDKVYLYIDFSDVKDGVKMDWTVSNISCNYITDDATSYACRPFNLNILPGEIWNFIAVEPGAWFYSVFDDHKTHHMYFLAGNEFKLLEFQDADSSGAIPHKEYRSTPITIDGKQYHVLYLSRTVDSVCPFPTDYYKLSELPGDEYFYRKLSEYSEQLTPYDRGDVLGLLALRNLLSANSGDTNIDLDDLKALLKGYTVAERQNPYLDDPNLDDAGHPTVSFHD